MSVGFLAYFLLLIVLNRHIHVSCDRGGKEGLGEVGVRTAFPWYDAALVLPCCPSRFPDPHPRVSLELLDEYRNPV